MKLYNLFLCLLVVSVAALFVSCEEDEFLDKNGTFNVSNISVTLDGILAYDAADLKLATLTFAQGSEGSASSANTEVKFNDGDWVSTGGSVNIPSTMEISLNDFLAMAGLSFADVAAGDVGELSFLINNSFRNGHTTIPITCSTDAVITNNDVELFLPPEGEAAEVPFDFDVDGPADVTSVDIVASYDGGEGAVMSTLNEWPVSTSFTLGDALTALGLAEEDLTLGKSFLFEFVLNSSVGCTSANSLSIVYGCPSNLAGTYDFSSTEYFCEGDPTMGTATWTSVGPGIYTIDDWAYGTYQVCYGGAAANWGTLQLIEVCNVLSITGIDNYGDGWSFTDVSTDGDKLTLKWQNEYGESGTSILTRQDGSDWPPLTK